LSFPGFGGWRMHFVARYSGVIKERDWAPHPLGFKDAGLEVPAHCAAAVLRAREASFRADDTLGDPYMCIGDVKSISFDVV
jgi:hypothetical protein